MVNYPAFQQALPHIVQPTSPQSPLATPTNYLSRSPTSPGSDHFFTAINSPSEEPTADTSSGRASSVPKLIHYPTDDHGFRKPAKDASKSSSQGRKKSPSLRSYLKKIKLAVYLKLNMLKYGLFLLNLVWAADNYIIQPYISSKQSINQWLNNPTKIKSVIVFEEIGKMATQVINSWK